VPRHRGGIREENRVQPRDPADPTHERPVTHHHPNGSHRPSKTGGERRRDFNPRTSPSHPLQTGRFRLSRNIHPLPASDPHHTTRTTASAGTTTNRARHHHSLTVIHRGKATTLPFPSEPSLAIPYLRRQKGGVALDTFIAAIKACVRPRCKEPPPEDHGWRGRPKEGQ
jgi:hypothetical protein